MDSTTRPRHEAARTAARARWGPQRLIRLDGLSPEQRRLVLAFVDMAKATESREKATAEVQSPAVAELEGHVHDRPAA